jgi:hypothetical protein
VSDFSDAKQRRGEAVKSCTPRASVGPYFAANHSPPSKKDSKMQLDTAATANLPKLNLPQDLLSEVQRKGKSKTDYGIEGMKPSLFGRFVEKLLGGKSSR